MNVTLRQLRAFVAVARHGSFTEAAVTLHVTQSALSGLVKELEDTLGVHVLHRSTRKVQPSDVGSAFLPLAQTLLQDLDRALGAITDLKALRAGAVRLAAPQLMACTLLPEVMGAFGRKHPQVRVRLVDGVADAVLTKVRSGEVDMGISPERDEQPDIDSQPLFEMPFVAVMRREHALARRKRLRWADLEGQALISLSGEFTRALNANLLAAGRQHALEPATEVTFMTTALSLASEGLGVAVCQPYARSLIKLYALRERALVEPVVTRRFVLLTRKDRRLSPAAEAFAKFLAAQAAKIGSKR